MSSRTTTLALTMLLSLAAVGPANAADPDKDFQADLAIRSARVETARARAATAPNATTGATLIEADDLLRQLRKAPPGKRNALRAQLDAALGRLDLEIDSATRFKP